MHICIEIIEIRYDKAHKSDKTWYRYRSHTYHWPDSSTVFLIFHMLTCTAVLLVLSYFSNPNSFHRSFDKIVWEFWTWLIVPKHKQKQLQNLWVTLSVDLFIQDLCAWFFFVFFLFSIAWGVESDLMIRFLFFGLSTWFIRLFSWLYLCTLPFAICCLFHSFFLFFHPISVYNVISSFSYN